MAPLTVLEQCHVSPSPGSADVAALPTTFFDLIFYRFPPVQRLLFYSFPHPKSGFLDSELPKLKRSLSLALRHFYPLAGRLTHPSDGRRPEIVYGNGDALRLVVAVSGDDFHELAADYPRDAARFHCLVPPLLSSGDEEAVLAVQVTIFPLAGVTVGTTLHHAAGDGATYTHFMKTWALINSAGESPLPLPFLDRRAIRDSKGLGERFMRDLRELAGDKSLEAWDLHGRSGVSRATFVLTSKQLVRLGRRTTSACSPYALACGYVWSCLVRARGGGGEQMERFGFVTGCRARLDPPVPAEYFGNCLGVCRVEARGTELTGEGGAAAASEAIWAAIRGLEDGAFGGAVGWVRDVFSYAAKKALTVAGSPKLGVYRVDFGWGRPRKVEIVSIERTGAMSLAEGRDGQGGIEVGLALVGEEMDKFAAIFAGGLPDAS